MPERQPTPDKPSDKELLEAIINVPGSTGETYSRFWNYSRRNIGFLALQGCPPEPVATYRTWLDLGRHVTKGSSAYYVMRPINVRVGEKVNAEGDTEVEMLRRFKIVKALFNYSQTAGDDLPPARPINWDADRAMTSLKIERVPFSTYNGNIGGYAVGRTVAINPMSPNPLRTTMHEISHIELGHTEEPTEIEYQLHRGTFEVEAETTAHLALKEIGELDNETASVSRGYIQGWLKDGEISDASVRKIFKTSDLIISAGQPNPTNT